MSATADQPTRSYYVAGISLITLAFVGHAIYLRKSSSADMEMFAYMGKLAATGGRIGVDLIDNKFPTVGLLMSVPYRLIGAHWLGYGLLSLLATNGAAFALARGARRHFGAVAYWPTLVAAMVWGNFFLCIFSIFQLEHLQLLLCSIAGIAALNALRDQDWRDALVVGLCAGLAAWSKPNALAVFGAFSVVALVRSQFKMFAAAGMGVIVPTAVAAACLHWSGTLSLLPDITRQISRYASHSAWNPTEIFSKLLDLALLFALPFLARCFLPLPVRGERAGERVLQVSGEEKEASGPRRSSFSRSYFPRSPFSNSESLSEHKEREAAFLFLWLVLEFLGGFLQGRMLPYYFLPMTAPAALLFGRMIRPPRVLPLFAGFAGPLAIACVGVVILFANTGGLDDKQRIVAYFKTHNLAGESVWVDDYPRLAVETDWQPASRMPLINLLTNDDEAPIYFGDMLLRDLAHNRPARLVLRRDESKLIYFFTRTQEDTDASPIRQTRMTTAIQSLYRYATAAYRPLTDVGQYTIWSRRDDAPPILVSVAEEQP